MILFKKIIFLIFSLSLIGFIIFLLLKGYGEEYGMLTLIFVILGIFFLKTGLFKTKDLDKKGRSKLIVDTFGMEGAFKFYIFFGIFCIVLGIIYLFIK